MDIWIDIWVMENKYGHTRSGRRRRSACRLSEWRCMDIYMNIWIYSGTCTQTRNGMENICTYQGREAAAVRLWSWNPGEREENIEKSERATDREE